MIKLTQERVIPKMMNPRNGMLKEHIARYHFASKYSRGRVLDIACGVGYGTEILLLNDTGDTIESIVGVDIDKESIQYACEHYLHSRAQFMLDDVLSSGLKDRLGTFDTILSFETIEHLSDDELFIENLVGLLNPGGSLIISTPFGRGRGIPCSNPYHYHQYKEDEFVELLRVFSQVELYHQVDETIEKPMPDKKYYLMVAVCKKESGEKGAK